jgi:hypothetical protein
MWETRLHRVFQGTGVKGGTVSPFHPLHGFGISTVLLAVSHIANSQSGSFPER